MNGPLPPDELSIDELIEYMSACAQIARNGADIHRGSKEMRHRSNMLDAVTDRLRDVERIEGLLLRYSEALDIIADSDFEMKMGEAFKLMRRTAREARAGKEMWWRKRS